MPKFSRFFWFGEVCTGQVLLCMLMVLAVMLLSEIKGLCLDMPWPHHGDAKWLQN